MNQPNPLKTNISDPFPTQPNPTRGSTQPTDNSGDAKAKSAGKLVVSNGSFQAVQISAFKCRSYVTVTKHWHYIESTEHTVAYSKYWKY